MTNDSDPNPKSSALIGALYFAALDALSKAPGGALKKGVLLKAIESSTTLDDWAKAIYPSGGIRWQTIFAWSSVCLSKGGFINKS
jgi:hypothetical protein